MPPGLAPDRFTGKVTEPLAPVRLEPLELANVTVRVDVPAVLIDVGLKSAATVGGVELPAGRAETVMVKDVLAGHE